jgi:hypothetical protein
MFPFLRPLGSRAQIISKVFLALIPSLFFLLVAGTYWGDSGSLDGMINFRETIHFRQGGLEEVIRMRGGNTHPPLLYLYTGLFFFLFGPSPLASNVAAFLLYLLGSILFFKLIDGIYGKKSAFFASSLLFCHPMVIVNSLSPMSEVMILVGFILSCLCYIKERYFLFSLSLVLLLLMKETAIIPVGILLFLWGIQRYFKYQGKHSSALSLMKALGESFLVSLPALTTLVAWKLALVHLGATEWKSQVLKNEDLSPFFIVFNNIFRFEMFNIYLLQNLENLFLLHFSWVYSLCAFIFYLFAKQHALWDSPRKKTFLLIFFSTPLVYAFLVFPFPTWTEPRYVIPVLPLLMIPLGLFLAHCKYKRLGNSVASLIFMLITVAQFTSLDPLSLRKGTETFHGETFYNLDLQWRGTDRVIYNTQFLRMTQNQNKLIQNAAKAEADILVTDCWSMKLSEKVWSIQLTNAAYPDLLLKRPLECIHDVELQKKEVQMKLTGKKVFVTHESFQKLRHVPASFTSALTVEIAP